MSTTTRKFDYLTITNLAEESCRKQRRTRGDKFATASEFLSIISDVWAWRELWTASVADALGLPEGTVFWPDHIDKTVTVDTGEPEPVEFGTILENGATVIQAAPMATEGHWIALCRYGAEWVTWWVDRKLNAECGQYFDTLDEALASYNARYGVEYKKMTQGK